ncbi:MAG: hypothetical protein WC765_09850, partial [Phycisphaerae bacterium]
MNLAKRKKEYEKLDWIYKGSMLFFVFFFGWLCSHIFYGISLLLHGSGNATYLILPSLYMWFLPSLFLGIISSVVPMKCIFKPLLGKRRYNELQLYIARKYKVKGRSRKQWTKRFYIKSAVTVLASMIIFPFM